MLDAIRLNSPSGASVWINANGSLRRFDCGAITVNLFPGNEMEGGPANVWLRSRRNGMLEVVPLLGPASHTRFQQHADGVLLGSGEMGHLQYSLALVLASSAPAWFWRVTLRNVGELQDVDLIYTQDLALAPYDAIRLNEYYVSQYVDHAPLNHGERGVVVASRQNQPAGGRHPWCVIGSLRTGVSFATDALQVYGLASRAGRTPSGLAQGLPGRRLQHEHSMAAIQDAPLRLERGGQAAAGFFGSFVADHPAATSMDDLRAVDEALRLPEVGKTYAPHVIRWQAPSATLFSRAALLAVEELSETELEALFGAERRHEERDGQGRLLSFFCGEDRHVALRAKELRVQRPHGHLLRTGRRLTPDESALTSTTWMGGVFHSMLTQGHVSINRFLSAARSYLGLFRSHGLRVFVEIEGEWRLLDEPSAWETTPRSCRWLYRHSHGEIDVLSQAQDEPHSLTLSIHVRSGPPARFLIVHHSALNGDDGGSEAGALWRREGEGVAVFAAAGTHLHQRFPEGSFLIAPELGVRFEQVGGDELLFLDGCSRKQPYVCIVIAGAQAAGVR
ncbi:MAG TPA: hypothetical protein VHK24_01470, partial [Steroidobacter sp.]|nr:hypothetical protein [Steroidobacter sp.]